VSTDPDVTILSEALWSDPGPDKGLLFNMMRGAGTRFGADQTREFLEMHGLSLLVRSHEGPDARKKRADPNINDMMRGFAVDHKRQEDETLPLLLTVFSASNYPQGHLCMNNEAAVLIACFVPEADANDTQSSGDDEYDMSSTVSPISFDGNKATSKAVLQISAKSHSVSLRPDVTNLMYYESESQADITDKE